MDFVFWIIVTVLIVGVVWWLLNRRNSPKTDGSGPVRADGGLTAGGAAAAAAPAEAPAEAPERSGVAEPAGPQGEWETQWSETGGTARTAADKPSAGESPASGPAASPEPPPASGPAAVHHAEYTEPHSPTLPGAETAAAEAADEALQPGPSVAPASADPNPAALPDNAPETETRERAASSAAAETAASHSAAPPAGAAGHEPDTEPAGHLAAEQPYGAGSASPAPDGSAQEDFTVKGDAGAMVYYEEGHPDYEQAKAEVWFESAAHAEAAGFRAPRRQRL